MIFWQLKQIVNIKATANWKKSRIKEHLKALQEIHAMKIK